MREVVKKCDSFQESRKLKPIAAAQILSCQIISYKIIFKSYYPDLKTIEIKLIKFKVHFKSYIYSTKCKVRLVSSWGK